MNRFDDAVAWATEQVRPYVVDKENIRFDGPIRAVLWNDLGLEWVPGETYRERFPANLGFTFELGPEKSRGHGIAISLGAAEYLTFRAAECQESYDLAVEIVMANLLADRDLPRPLATFTALVMGNQWDRPLKEGHPGNWGRDYHIRRWIEYIIIEFGLNATRGHAAKVKASACDVICQAFAACGYPHITSKTVKTIWDNRNNKKLRSESNRLRQSQIRKLSGEAQVHGLGLLAYRLPCA